MKRPSTVRGNGRAVQLASAVGFVLAMSHAAGAASFTTFVVDGATQTIPWAIDAAGDVAGSWYDSGYVPHGFLRTANGTITTFDPPGATETHVYGMNDNLAVVGSFEDGAGLHGFIRAADGTITVYDAPGAVDGTEIFAINDDNVYGGDYYADDGNGYGFVVNAKGKFKSFGVSGQRYTVVTALNSMGVAAGGDSGDEGLRAFVRSRKGVVTVFDIPGGNDPAVAGINRHGNIAGTSWQYGVNNSGQGYLRLSDGTVTTFQVVPGYETDGYGLNVHNMICGNYYDADGGYHGYIRKAAGGMTTFDAPGGTGSTGCRAINDSGVAAGYFYDSQDVGNAYLRTP
ncbi:MAG TPA: hypothetical protein VKR31_08210 [Rhizomicrobium sp.]|nr:hypothetical protein [Rhizomicrobium sp.]